MLNLLPSVLVLGLCIAILVIVRRGVLSRRREDLAIAAHQGTAADAVVAEKILRVMRTRNIAAITLAVLGVVGAFLLQSAFRQTFGLFVISAPLIAALMATGVYACWQIPSEPKVQGQPAETRISAGLTPRSTGMFGPAWGILVPGMLLGSLLVGLLLAGTFSGPDENGKYRNLPHMSFGGATLDENMMVTEILPTTGSSGPFPGWYYGVPLMGLLVIVGILTLVALHNNVRRPSLRSAGLHEFDNAVRNHEGYVLSTGLSMLLCFQAVPLLFMAATSIYSAGTHAAYEVGMVLEDGVIPPLDVDTGLAALSAALGIIALLLIVTGVALLVKLAGWMGPSFGSLKHKQSDAAAA